MTARAARFAGVGAMGFAVQLGALALLVSGAGMPYEVATAVAVECAIVHNFLWHEHWTWRDRAERAGRLARFARFNGATALLSIGGNVALMRLFVGHLHLPLLAANALAVAAISAVTFLCADRLVFRKTHLPSPTAP